MLTIDAALDYMLGLICDGWEFPDAAYRAARKFGVKQAALEAAYDDHCSDEKQLGRAHY